MNHSLKRAEQYQHELSAPLPRPQHGGNLVWAARLAGCAPDLLLDFSASINPLGPPQSAIAAIQARLGQLVSYPDPNYTQLRAAIAQHHDLSPDWILPGNGAAELITWACRDLAALDTVLLPTPAFSDYTRALRAFNAAIFNQALGDFQATPPASLLNLPSAAVCQSAQTGLLLNNPHNPTGYLFAQDILLPLLETFALVVVDEAFMDFLPPADQSSVVKWIEQYPNLVVVRSLTKFYSLPGLRLGYAIAHPDRLNRWQQWRDPWSVNTLAAAVGEVVLQDTEFQQQTWNWLVAARASLFQRLGQLPGLHPLPGTANFLLVQAECSVAHLQTNLLLQQRILIRDCLSFAELGDRYFRVAVRTLAENQQLVDGLSELLVA